MSGEFAYLGFAEAAELIRAKKLSPVEYVTALLARIERHDGKYNAFIALTPERALKAARVAEAEITGGRRRGPFHGVPYALKDIIDVEGLATTAHSKILKGNLARRHAVVTERLEAAGGQFCGKLLGDLRADGVKFWKLSLSPPGESNRTDKGRLLAVLGISESEYVARFTSPIQTDWVRSG